MKRILLLLLLLTTVLYACPATAEEAPAADTETGELTLFDIRYYFEHRMLPQQFYKDSSVSFGFPSFAIISAVLQALHTP